MIAFLVRKGLLTRVFVLDFCFEVEGICLKSGRGSDIMVYHLKTLFLYKNTLLPQDLHLVNATEVLACACRRFAYLCYDVSGNLVHAGHCHIHKSAVYLVDCL